MSAGTQQWLWLGVALGAASLSALAFWVLGRARPERGVRRAGRRSNRRTSPNRPHPSRSRPTFPSRPTDRRYVKPSPPLPRRGASPRRQLATGIRGSHRSGVPRLDGSGEPNRELESDPSPDQGPRSGRRARRSDCRLLCDRPLQRMRTGARCTRSILDPDRWGQGVGRALLAAGERGSARRRPMAGAALGSGPECPGPGFLRTSRMGAGETDPYREHRGC